MVTESLPSTTEEVECRSCPSTIASSCLRAQATAACRDDPEDRLGALNRKRSQLCCPNRVFGNDNDAMLDSSLKELSPLYKKIRVRVIIVTGDSDMSVSPQKNAFELHRNIPNSDLVVIPRAGHQIPQMHPETVRQAVDIAAVDSSI